MIFKDSIIYVMFSLNLDSKNFFPITWQIDNIKLLNVQGLESDLDGWWLILAMATSTGNSQCISIS